MNLKDFLKEEQLSIARFCKQTGLNEATVTKWKFAGVIPRKPEMLKVYEFTEGKVSPNDFYGINQ
jgi:hypothetical protein